MEFFFFNLKTPIKNVFFYKVYISLISVKRRGSNIIIRDKLQHS